MHTICVLVFLFSFITFSNTYGCSPCTCTNNFKWIEYGNNMTLRTASCIKLNISTLPLLDTDIEGVAMYNNKFTSLKENFLIRYTNLKALAAGDNKIRFIDKNAFKSMQNLVYIDMNSNLLTSLPTELFRETLKLKTFTILRNNITHLQNYLFSNLLDLTYVNFYGNNINVIEQYCFINVPSLQTLNLRNNYLKTLDLTYYDFPNLKYLYLLNNPWNCDESLCNTINVVVSGKLWGNDSSPICATPSNMKGKYWNETKTEFAPHIITPISSIYEEDDIILTCKYCFISDVVWTVNGRILASKYYETSVRSLTSTLILRSARSKESAEYSCQVDNCDECKTDFKHVAVNKKFKDLDINKTSVDFSANYNNYSKPRVPAE